MVNGEIAWTDVAGLAVECPTLDIYTTLNTDVASDFAVFSGFGQIVPSDAIVDSLSFTITVWYDISPVTIAGVYLFADSTSFGSNVGGASWDDVVTFGGDSTYWGTSLTPAVINSVGVGFQTYGTYDDGLIAFRCVSATVYYHGATTERSPAVSKGPLRKTKLGGRSTNLLKP